VEAVQILLAHIQAMAEAMADSAITEVAVLEVMRAMEVKDMTEVALLLALVAAVAAVVLIQTQLKAVGTDQVVAVLEY
jgi:hypothetical protein